MGFPKLRSRVRRAVSWQEIFIPGGLPPDKSPQYLIRWFQVLALFALGAIFLKLVKLQVVEGASFRHRADENRVITRRLSANRGAILDRNGHSLVRNTPKYYRISPDSLITKDKFEPIDRDQALSLAVSDDQWIFFVSARDYPFSRALAPVLGYVGQIDEAELKRLAPTYVAGDVVGKLGIEAAYEAVLRGSPGLEMIEVNSIGELIRTIGRQDPLPGQDVRLSLDVGVQQRLYQLLEGYTGAAVVSDPQTGEILALVSRPSFDPNNIVSSLAEPNEPFFNRAIAGSYPPGSLFKIVTATTGLEEGVIDSDFTVEDTGEIRIGEYRYGNWYFDQYGRTEGTVNLVKAIQRSNDIFFYKVGEAVGPRLLAKWAKLFGLGQPTGIDLIGEADGLVPTPEWREKFIGSRWFLGNTYHYAIGQGDLLVTPLQMNQVVAAIAIGGQWCQPQLVKTSSENTNCRELSLSSNTISLITEGMKAACQTGGTAFPFFDFSSPVACKTGTAQFGDKENRTHAWFTVFAPADNPKIVVTVILEKAGEGSREAAPIARKVLDYWFSQHQ